MTTAITVALLVILLVIGLPVAFALLLSAAVGLFLIGGPGLVLGILQTTPSTAVSSYELITIPMFILMAEFMIVSRVADEMFELIGRWVRRLPGGLAIATAISGAAFGAVSGSSTAAAATLSASSVPTMIKHGYDPRFASGVVAISGTLAMLIPPSIALILYGLLSGESIAVLLIAGIVPGLMVLAVIILTVFTLIWIRPSWAPRMDDEFSKESHSVAALLFLLLFLIVTGAIYLGVATPTEASAIGAFGALLIAVGRGTTNLGMLRQAVYRALRTTAMIGAIIIGAQVFGYFLTITQIPNLIISHIGDMDVPSWVILIGIICIYLVLGMFLDQIAILILTVPIMLPLIVHLGYDPVWFGVLIVVLAEIGLVTPPVGINAFVVSRYTGVPLEDVFIGVIPHILAHFVVIILLVLFPALVLWLPNTM
ncbi:TRAP transporter large permease [Sneathiella sp.]|uniref:TRAP transporter large permease n=1 Tax=Sneathiella sp. TaxID=1964365 RepID=UPI0035665841